MLNNYPENKYITLMIIKMMTVFRLVSYKVINYIHACVSVSSRLLVIYISLFDCTQTAKQQSAVRHSDGKSIVYSVRNYITHFQMPCKMPQCHVFYYYYTVLGYWNGSTININGDTVHINDLSMYIWAKHQMLVMSIFWHPIISLKKYGSLVTEWSSGCFCD